MCASCCRCIIGSDGKPSCDLAFSAITRASGTSQIRRVPKDGTVKFVSCSVTMDTTTETSSTCFEVRSLRLLILSEIPLRAQEKSH